MLEALGFMSLPDLMAGTLGGVCNVYLLRRQGVFAISGAVVVGAITGGYSGTWVAGFSHIPNTLCALVIGFSGGAFLKIMGAQLMKRIPGGINGNGDKP